MKKNTDKPTWAEVLESSRKLKQVLDRVERQLKEEPKDPNDPMHIFNSIFGKAPK